MWTFFKSVFAGSDHVSQNMPCQDYADFTITENEIYVSALSDGASASAFGDIAAMCNVNAVLNSMHRVNFDSFYMADSSDKAHFLISACQENIAQYFKRLRPADLREFAATLLMMVSDGKRMVLGHIGDGVICAMDSSGNAVMLSSPNNVDLARDRTYFTVSKDAESVMNFVTVDDIDKYTAFILMSDGPEASFYNYTLNQLRSNNLLTITNEIASERARELELTYFLKSNFWKHGITGDDCSMVIFAKELD